MDTGFLNNTANVLIICFTIVVIILLIIWISIRRNVTITKEGIKIIDPYPYDTFSVQIPGIDEWLKNKLRSVMLDNVDSLFGMMNGLDPIVRQTLLLAVLDEISQRISVNGFAKVLTNSDQCDRWIKDRKHAIMSKVNAYENDISSDNIGRALDNVLAYIKHEFALRTRMACEKKLLVYEKYAKQSGRVKALIKKNNDYIEELKKL